ncbi:MAG: polyhydroxyalkanoate synthesis repressor PhaR [Hydrogenophilus sp.]|nr:polyhydroxyalkanoate synthesis repressor PhaR [Hydrogenophilus sp.]
MKAAERLIKKYPNRRLYDTATSTYITLSDIKEMVLRNEAVRVIDAKSHADITRTVFLQILLEEEIGGAPLFSTEMLAQIIRFYGHASRTLFGQYLETSLKTFIDLQNQFQERMRALYGDQAAVTPELLAQFLTLQPAAMRTMLETYLTETQNLWRRWNAQIEQQTRGWFTLIGTPSSKDEG